MLTDRDLKTILSIGYHQTLSQPQIQKLHFPSYDSCQRRIREELRKNKYISDPFYIHVDLNGSRLALYKLRKKGREIFENFAGREYNNPNWSYKLIPHLSEINRLLIDLIQADLISQEDFEIEKDNRMMIINKEGQEEQLIVRMDAYCEINNKAVAIEVDYSEKIKRKKIQQQYLNYEKLYIETGLPQLLIYFSNRPEWLYRYINEVANPNLDIIPFFVRRNNKEIKYLIEELKKYCNIESKLANIT